MPQFNVARVASGNGVSPNQARANFAPDDRIEWSAFAAQSLLQFTTDPATGAKFVTHSTTGNRDIVVTHPLDLVRLAQGPAGGWNGNFPNQEAILFTNDRPPPVQDPLKESIVIHFRVPVRGVGLQFQGSTLTASPNLSFKANLVLWDLNRADWGQPAHAVGTNADASAVFLGAFAANPVVSTAQIYVDAMNGQQIDFAIGSIAVRN
jgi:hypothetical protein